MGRSADLRGFRRRTGARPTGRVQELASIVAADPQRPSAILLNTLITRREVEPA